MNLDDDIREYITQFIPDEELHSLPSQLIDQVYLLQRILAINPEFSLLPILREETNRRDYRNWLRTQFDPLILPILEFVDMSHVYMYIDKDGELIIETNDDKHAEHIRSMLEDRGIPADIGEYGTRGNRMYETIIRDQDWISKLHNGYKRYKTYDQWLYPTIDE